MLEHPPVQYTAFLTVKAPDPKIMYDALLEISGIEIYPVKGGQGDNIFIKITAKQLTTILGIREKILRESKKYNPKFHPTVLGPLIANSYFKPLTEEKVETSEIVQPVQSSNQ